jgi:hypothetical protein
VQLERAAQLPGFIERTLDADAVETGRGVERTVRGGAKGELSTQTKARGHNATVAPRQRTRGEHRRFDIVERELLIEACEEAERAGQVLGPVREFDVRLLPPEQIGSQRQITAFGETIGDQPHGAVHSKDLLQDDNGRCRRGRGLRHIGVERTAVER